MSIIVSPTSYTFLHEPLRKERARAGNGVHYTPEKTRRYEDFIAANTAAQHPAQMPPHTTRLFTEINFFVDEFRMDIDNMVKAIWDGMQPRKKHGFVVYPGAFRNDNLIDGLYVRRWYEPRKSHHRTEVLLTPLPTKPEYFSNHHCQTCSCGL